MDLSLNTTTLRHPEINNPQTQSFIWQHAPVYEADLILEGGAMRGLFTAGVLDVLMDERIALKHCIGVSAGALNGYNYVAGDIGRTCYLNLKYCQDPRYLSLWSFFKTGNIFGREFSFEEIPVKLEEYPFDFFRKSPLDLTVVSSNLVEGEADYHKVTDPLRDKDYLIASSSLPMFSQIVQVDGKYLLDGGICDSIPLEYSLDRGSKKQVLVLTQDETYVKKSEKLMPFIAQKYSDYPLFIERMEHRAYDYNRCTRRIKELESAGKIFVLRPQKPVEISHLERDPEKLMDLYLQGVEVAKGSLIKLKAYLEAPIEHTQNPHSAQNADTYGMRKVFLSTREMSYQKHLAEGSFDMDCSLGENPCGSAVDITSLNKATITNQLAGIAHYPHNESSLAQEILRTFDIGGLTQEHISFYAGAIGALQSLNRLLLDKHARFVCTYPCFSAMVDDVARYEAYISPFMLQEKQKPTTQDSSYFTCDVDRLIAHIEANPHSYVYIDNPNNPTGDYLEPQAIEELVHAAKKARSFIVVDEAYADYLPNSKSAIHLVLKYENLACVRSFSKGYGLPGLRIGYVVAQSNIQQALDKAKLPFSLNSLAPWFACEALKSSHNSNSAAFIASHKPEVLRACTANNYKDLHPLSSHESIPIFTLETNHDINLAELFFKQGVRTISGSCFPGLNKRFCRITMPFNVDEFIARVEVLKTQLKQMN